jgi:hypothetical protein
MWSAGALARGVRAMMPKRKKKAARRSSPRTEPSAPPSIRWGRAIGDVCVAEEWAHLDTLQLWVAGDHGTGTVCLLTPERAELLRDSLTAWLANRQPATNGRPKRAVKRGGRRG